METDEKKAVLVREVHRHWVFKVVVLDENIAVVLEIWTQKPYSMAVTVGDD